MKHRYWTLPIAVVMIPMAASAIEMTDFKDPESTSEHAYLTGSFNTRTGNQDQTSYDVAVEANYLYDFSSLPQTWGVALDGLSDISRGQDNGAKTEDDSTANLSTYFNRYLKNHPKTFWFGDTEINYQSEEERARIELKAGLGYGRVILATPLAKVFRIEEELREQGVILGRISDAVYLELAQVLAKENQYISEHGLEEYRAYWIADFEAILKREGLLRNDALGAIGVLQMDRVLIDEYFPDRKHGWKVGAGFGSVLQDFETDESKPSFTAFFEYTHPSGYKGQFINRLDYSLGLEEDRKHYLTNDMSYSHEISDRIDWVSSWLLTLETFDDGRDNEVDNSLLTTFRYYVTNRIQANVNFKVSRVEDGVLGDGDDETDIVTYGSLTYRLK